MNLDFKEWFVVFLLFVFLPVTSQAVSMVPGGAIDTATVRQTVNSQPCAVCHDRPDFDRLSYERWTSLIKLVPRGMMPVKGKEEREGTLRAIRRGEVTDFYRSRCSNCHQMPDPVTLDVEDWRGRLYQLEGLEMPVMSEQRRRDVLGDLADAHGRDYRPDTAAEWFDIPKERKKAPLPNELAQATEQSVLLLHFWSPGCLPCLDELPGFKDFVQSIPDTVPLTVRVVAVTRKRAKTRRKLDVLSEQQLFFDRRRSLADRLNVAAYPTNYLIGSDGKFVTRMIGRRPWKNPRFRDAVHDLARRWAPSPPDTGPGK